MLTVRHLAANVAIMSDVVMLKKIFVCLNYRGSGCDEFITHGANKLS